MKEKRQKLPKVRFCLSVTSVGVLSLKYYKYGRYNSIENLSFCSLLYSENGCKMLSFLEILLPMLILKTFCNKNEIKLKKGEKL